MADFSSYHLLMSMLHLILLFALVFAIFEKVNKERFVINQTNQRTRKLFGELINSGTATVTVATDGKISFFNETFRSLVIDRLLFENLPSNIFGIFEADSNNQEQLQQMLLDTYSSDKGRNRAENANVIEVRIPRKK